MDPGLCARLLASATPAPPSVPTVTYSCHTIIQTMPITSAFVANLEDQPPTEDVREWEPSNHTKCHVFL